MNRAEQPPLEILAQNDFLILPILNGADRRFRRATDEETALFSQRTQRAMLEAAANIEQPLTTDQQELAEILKTNIEEWGRKQLGIDIRTRRPLPEAAIRLPIDHPRYKDAPRFGSLPDSRIIFIPELAPSDVEEGIDLRAQESKNISHELVHAYGSSIRVVAHPEETDAEAISSIEFGRHIACGFLVGRLANKEGERFSSLFSLNESVTEMINIELLALLRDTQGIDLLTNLPPSYPIEVILFDMIFNNMSQKLNISPEDLRKKIYQMYFRGRESITRVIASAFDHKTARMIAEADKDFMSTVTNFLILIFLQKLSTIENIKEFTIQHPDFSSAARLMEMTNVDPLEASKRAEQLIYENTAEITGTSGKITFHPA